MVMLPSQAAGSPESFSASTTSFTPERALNGYTRAIVTVVDAVGSIRDGNHLQGVMFLAQELNVLPAPHFMFAFDGPEPYRPHSSLLAAHVENALRRGIIAVDDQGRLRVERDQSADGPPTELVHRLRALSALSPDEVTIFACAVLRLTRDGRHAGSHRHDGAFRETVLRLSARAREFSTTLMEASPTRVCSVRWHLIPADAAVLSPA